MNSEAFAKPKIMPRASHIVIGICTFQRAGMLDRALQSLKDMAKPGECCISIVVADNDSKATASQVVSGWKDRMDLPLYYLVEPRPGIPFVRNRILRKTKKLKGDVLVFIDDDEYVEPDWLVKLWHAYTATDADALIGYVRTVYPEDTPGWIVRGSFYQRDKLNNGQSYLVQAICSLVKVREWDGVINKSTGDLVTFGRTGNSLIGCKKIVDEMGLQFDEDFGLRGGSDAEFFKRAIQKGARVRWVGDAVVNEPLQQERMSLAYFIRRNFKSRNYAHEGEISLKRRGKTALRGTILGVSGFLSFPVNIFRGMLYTAQSIKLMVAAVALLLSAANVFVKWEEYKR